MCAAMSARRRFPPAGAAPARSDLKLRPISSVPNATNWFTDMDDEFRNEVAGITRGDLRVELEIADVDDPLSRGWLRRSEFDVPGLQAWERPDGTVVGLREA